MSDPAVVELEEARRHVQTTASQQTEAHNPKLLQQTVLRIDHMCCGAEAKLAREVERSVAISGREAGGGSVPEQEFHNARAVGTVWSRGWEM